jgi:hypothetical protein
MSGVALRAGAAAAGLALSLLSGGCGSMDPETKEVVENVLTLQQGAVSNLRDLRGRGPFRDYCVAPEVMLDLATKVLKERVVAVFPNPRALEVVAKERCAKDAADDTYAPAFVSAVVVIIHPVDGEPDRSRVEVHATQRSPFIHGHIAWEKDVPAALDAAVAAHRRPQPPPAPPPRVKTIP